MLCALKEKENRNSKEKESLAPDVVSLNLDDVLWHYQIIPAAGDAPGLSATGRQGLTYETTWRCQKNPFIGALGIQEPVIPGEPLFKG